MALQFGALLHQKSYPAFFSPGNQESLVTLSDCEFDAGDGPPITSSCHCSSKVCEAGGPGSCACRAEGYGFARVDSVRGNGVATPRKSPPSSVRDYQPPRSSSPPTLP